MESAFRKPLKQSLRNSFLFLTVPWIHFRLLLYSVQVGANPFVTPPFPLFPNLFFFFWEIISLLRQAFLRPLSLPQLKQSVPVQPPPSCAVFRPQKSLSVWTPIIHKLWLYSALFNLITVSWGTSTTASTENASSVESQEHSPFRK